jgi:hypothetical protein
VKISDFSRYVFGITTAVAILGGCGGGSQSQLAPSAPLQQSGAQLRLGQLPEGLANTAMSGAAQTRMVALHTDHSPSWMAPGAATQDLLYISNYAGASVVVYSYPQDKLVGKLTGHFANPDGLCVDKKGDVWIVNNDATHSGEDVVEYKHGGKKPIAILEIGNGYAVSCSIDPTTGNLAATVLDTVSGGSGYVAIFKNAKGSPKYYYTNPGMSAAVYFCGYDNKGNLYVDAAVSSVPFQFAELPKGKKTFTIIKLKGATIHFPGDVQWDGKYVTVADQQCGAYPYPTCIYQTTGAGGKIVGSTPFNGSGDIVHFWIDGNTVIGPIWAGISGYNTVPFWKYPAGGKPAKTLKNGFDDPIGAAVSVAQ